MLVSHVTLSPLDRFRDFSYPSATLTDSICTSDISNVLSSSRDLCCIPYSGRRFLEPPVGWTIRPRRSLSHPCDRMPGTAVSPIHPVRLDS